MTRLIHELLLSPIKSLQSGRIWAAMAFVQGAQECSGAIDRRQIRGEGFMANRASSAFALVRGCKDSSGLGEFVLSCWVMLILLCAVATAQTATGQFNGHVFDP